MRVDPSSSTADPQRMVDAESRTRRRARARTLARRGALAVSFLSALAAVALAWLLLSLSGRDVLLARIVAMLPAGSSLRWERAEGPVAGPLTLYGVRFEYRDCSGLAPSTPDGRGKPGAPIACADVVPTVFTAARLRLEPELMPAFGRTLRLKTLTVEDARLILTQSDEPFALPRWPDALPALPMPLQIETDAVSVRRLRILQAQAGTGANSAVPTQVIAIAHLRGGVVLGDGALSLRDVVADTDRGWYRVEGEYLPRDRYRMHLTVGARMPPLAGRTPARLGLVARGDVRDLVVALSGDAPARTRASLRLQGDRAPRWRFAAHSAAFDPHLLGLDDDAAAPPLRFDLNAEGVGGDARLQGAATRGDLSLRVLPSRIGLDAQVLTLSPLSLALAEGGVGASGRLSLADPADPHFEGHLAARRLRWRGAVDTAAVEGSGDFAVRGRLADWRVDGRAALLRDGERAALTLRVRGDAGHARFERLQAVTPNGRLDGEGDLQWSPALAWDAQMRMDAFDPGFVLPDWSGAVDARLHSRGRREHDGALHVDVSAQDLGGRLRGRSIAGRAQTRLRLPTAAGGLSGEGEIDLRLGESRVQATGRLSDTIAVDARLSPLRLDDALPGARGRVQGSLQLRGSRKAPEIAVDLEGTDVVWSGYLIGRAQAQGRLPWRGGDGVLRVQAQDVALGLELSHLRVDARGSVETLRIDADAAAAGLALEVGGDARRNGAQWQGTVARMRIVPEGLAAWTLTAPTAWTWRARRLRVAAACFLTEGADSGRLCAQADWPGRATVEGRALPLALISPLLPQRSRRDGGGQWVPEGRVDLDLAVTPRGASWQGTAQLRSDSGGISLQQRNRREVLGYGGLRADVRFDPQRVAVEWQAALRPDGRVSGRVDTGWDDDAPLQGELRVQTTALTWMELLSPDIVEPQGRLDADLRLSGRRGAPAFDGIATLSAFRAELPALGTGLREGEVRMQADTIGAARIEGRAKVGEGTLRVDGTYDWRSPQTPLLLAVTGQNIRISDTRELRASIDPNLTVRYAAGQPLIVAGSVRIPTARMDLEGLSGGVAVSEDVVVLDPVHPDEAPATPLDLDLALEMGEDVRLRGFGLDGTLSGDVRMRARPGRESVANGRLDVAGHYTAYGQKLKITRGRLVWSNRAFADPLLDIRAERALGSVTAGIDVTGRASAPQAEVWSDPASSQSEALSYLALGRPLSTLTAEQTRNLSAASAALSAGGNLIAGQIAERIGLDDAGISESRALGGSVVGIGKYLSPRLYVGYGVSLLGTGQVLTLRYLLRKGFDIELESSSVENRGSLNWRKEK